MFTVNLCLIPFRVNKKKNNWLCGHTVLLCLKTNLWPFGKPVINWQHYLQIQILARKNTSWQTKVLMYLSKFNLLNESWWNKGYIAGMFSFASYFIEPFSSIYHLLLYLFSTKHSHLVYFCFHVLFAFIFLLYLDYILVWFSQKETHSLYLFW